MTARRAPKEDHPVPGRRREAALVLLLAMLLPSFLLSPVNSVENIKLGLVTEEGVAKPPTSDLDYLHTKASGFPLDHTNPTAPTASTPRNKNVTLIGGTQPVVSNVRSNQFTVSWVMEVNGTGKVQCSSNENMTGSRWTSDARQGIASAVVYVNVTNCGSALASGTTYYWRAWFNTTGCTAGCVTGSQIANVSWPPGAPYPAVRTKTSGATQSGNPTVPISPYEDRNANSAYNAAGVPACNGPGIGPPADAPLCEFLVYANHSGAGTITFRSINLLTIPPRWTAYVDTDQFRDNTSVGAPHALSAGETVQITAVGLYNDLSTVPPQKAPAIWTASYLYTCVGGPPCGGVPGGLNAQKAAVTVNFKGVGFGLESAWLSETALAEERGAAGIFTQTWHELDGDGAPRIANLGTSAFRVAWVTKEPVKGMIQVGTSPTLSGATYYIDPRWVGIPCTVPANCIVNATVVADAVGLSAGTRYYWRAVEDDLAGHNRSFPSSPPYPSVWTKTDVSAPPTTNPTLLLRPFADMNNNGVSECSTNQEYRLRNFTGFVKLLTPLASEPLAARAAGGGGSPTSCVSTINWRITLNLNNLRANTSAGVPITMSVFPTGTNFVFEARVSGLHLDPVAGRHIWKSRVQIITITKCTPWPSCFSSPSNVNVPTTRQVDFLGLDDRARHMFRFNATQPGYLGMVYMDTAESKYKDEERNGAINHYYDVEHSFPSTRVAVFGQRDIAFSSNGGGHWFGSRGQYLIDYDWTGGAFEGTTLLGWAVGTEPDGSGYAIMRTYDGAASWDPTFRNATGSLREIVADIGGIAMGVGTGLVACTIDGGATWALQGSAVIGATQYNDISVWGSGVVAVGAGGKIIRHTSWTSCANSWSSVTSGTTKDLYGVRCITPYCVAVGDGVILRSSDSGASWTASGDPHIGITKFYGADRRPSFWIAVGEGGKVLRSTDEGASWSQDPPETLSTLRSVSLATDTSGVSAGLEATIVRYAGTSWTLRNVPVGDRIRISYQPDARRHTAAGVVYDGVNQSSHYEFREGSLPSSARTHNVTTHRADQTERLNDTLNTAGAPDPTKWSSATAVVTSDCGSTSGANSLHFETKQRATTVNLNFLGASHAQISFSIRKGDGTGTCHAAESDKELFLNYSTDNFASWGCLVEFEPGDNPLYQHGCVFYEELAEGWFSRNYALPTAAHSSTLRLRFEINGTDAFDDFAIDDVVVAFRSRWIGAYMNQYNNEDASPTRYVVIMALAEMTDLSRTRTSIDRAHIRVYRYSDSTLLYEADMAKTGIYSTSQQETFTTGYLDLTVFGGGAADGTIFVAIVDTYDTTGSSDAILGHISKKIGFFQFDPDT
jgi:hypothetical protein